MPITSRGIKFLSFIKNEECLKSFLESAKNVQNSKGAISNKELKNLALNFGIPDSLALSILSFYEMIKLGKNGKPSLCGGPACNHEVTPPHCVDTVNCLGLCDIINPAIYQNKQVSFIKKGWTEIPNSKILNGVCENVLLNPLKREHYIEKTKELLKISSDELLEKIFSSNLTGRGGAGFPTAKKIKSTRNSSGEKVLICNFDESEPFVFKDRGIVEHNPFSVLSGMIITAKLIRSRDIFIYVRGEYIKQKGIIDDTLRFFRTHFKDYNFFTVSGAGAYVCGEETALMESMEGKRGHPRKKPPFPFEKGLLGKPTLVLNVETLGWIFEILDKDLKFSDRRVFCLTGDVIQRGIFESDGTLSINEIVFKYAKGYLYNSRDYFGLIGGASGFFVDQKQFDKPLNELIKNKSGAGSLFIFHGDKKFKDVMLYILKFFSHESCGQCNPCFMGYKRLFNLIENDSLNPALELSQRMSKSTLCGLGKAGLTPLSSYFWLKSGGDSW